jgi:hypothetical protein
MAYFKDVLVGVSRVSSSLTSTLTAFLTLKQDAPSNSLKYKREETTHWIDLFVGVLISTSLTTSESLSMDIRL